MCDCCEKSDLSKLTPVFEAFAGDDHALISILQKAQDIYGYLPTDVLYAIAEKTGNSPAKVMGVATFYTQFRLKPVGKNLILLCKGTARSTRSSASSPSARTSSSCARARPAT